jgi:hypothetical protein
MGSLASLWIGWLYRNVYVIDPTGRWRYRRAIFTEAREVKFDCFAELGFGLFDRGPSGDAARKIGYVARKILSRLFNHDRVAHLSLTS